MGEINAQAYTACSCDPNDVTYELCWCSRDKLWVEKAAASWLSAEHRKVPKSLWHCGEGALLATAPSKLSNTGETAYDLFLKVQDFLVRVKYGAFVSPLDKGWADLYGGVHCVYVCMCVYVSLYVCMHYCMCVCRAL